MSGMNFDDFDDLDIPDDEIIPDEIVLEDDGEDGCGGACKI